VRSFVFLHVNSLPASQELGLELDPAVQQILADFQGWAHEQELAQMVQIEAELLGFAEPAGASSSSNPAPAGEAAREGAAASTADAAPDEPEGVLL